MDHRRDEYYMSTHGKSQSTENTARSFTPINLILAGITIAALLTFNLCNRKSKLEQKTIPNLGVVQVPLSKDGREIQAQIMDVDRNTVVDGVLGEGYLMLYKPGYENHPAFKEFYDPEKSVAMTGQDVAIFSKMLRKNNAREYRKSLEEKNK